MRLARTLTVATLLALCCTPAPHVSADTARTVVNPCASGSRTQPAPNPPPGHICWKGILVGPTPPKPPVAPPPKPVFPWWARGGLDWYFEWVTS